MSSTTASRPQIHWASRTNSKYEASAAPKVHGSTEYAQQPMLSNDISAALAAGCGTQAAPQPSRAEFTAAPVEAQARPQHPTQPQLSREACIPTFGSVGLCAGPQHKPHGGIGAAIGIVGGLFFLPALIFLPGIGYVVAKDRSRKRHSIKMYDESGRLVRVKLWKSGKSAPLTEHGFRLVTTDYRHEQMVEFLGRKLLSMGALVTDRVAFLHFVDSQQLRLRTLPLDAVLAELRLKPWVYFSSYM